MLLTITVLVFGIFVGLYVGNDRFRKEVGNLTSLTRQLFAARRKTPEPPSVPAPMAPPPAGVPVQLELPLEYKKTS